MKKLFMLLAISGLLLLAGCFCEEMCEAGRSESCHKPASKEMHKKKTHEAKEVHHEPAAKKMKKKKHDKMKSSDHKEKSAAKKASHKKDKAVKKHAYAPKQEQHEVAAWLLD